MPLAEGNSRADISRNIATEINAGKSKAQSVAIAYHEAGKDRSISSREYDVNNWCVIKGNPLSKVGIFPYSGRSILGEERIAQLLAEGNEAAVNKMYNVYRPEEELSDPETINSFKLIPWVDDHTMLGGRERNLTPAEEKGIEGVIGDEVYFDNGVLYGNIKIFSESLRELIESGKSELSAGYWCVYDFTPGVWKGIAYDAIQRKIRGNHLALVSAGRMGPDVAVLDHLTFTFDAKELQTMAEKEKELEERLKKTEDSLKTALDMLEKMSTKDAEEEKEKKEKEAKDAEEKEERKKEEEAKDEEEKAEKEKLAKDAEEAKKTGMDAAELARNAVKELADFKRNGLKIIAKEAKETTELASQLSVHIGTFDHSEKTLDEVAKYGAEKLGLKCPTGHEVTAVRGFLHNRSASFSSTYSMDSQAGQGSDELDAYIAGK